MIVVAIIGILAAIAIPKFAELIRKSGEGATKGNLGAIRSALSIYYGEMEGVYPSSPDAMTISGKYIQTIPKAKTYSYHSDSATSLISNFATGMTDAGGWVYDGLPPPDANFGAIFVNCTHTDSKNNTYSSY